MFKVALVPVVLWVLLGCATVIEDAEPTIAPEKKTTEIDLTTPENAFVNCNSALKEERLEDYQKCFSECSPAPPNYIESLKLAENEWKLQQLISDAKRCGSDITREPDFLVEKGVVELAMTNCVQLLTLDRDGKWRFILKFEEQSTLSQTDPLYSYCQNKFQQAWAE